MLRLIRAGARVLVGLTLSAGVHAATEAPAKAPAASPEKGPAAVSSEKPRPASSPEVTVPSDRSANRAPDQRPRYKGRTIRCWQFGRLILEEPVVDGPKPDGQVHYLKQPGNGPGLQLLELKDAVCLVGGAAQ
jgi:hypothetical protein